MSKYLSRIFFVLIVVFTLLSSLQSFAVDLSEEFNETLSSVEKLTDDDYAKFCTDDKQYTVQNLYSGESLTYDNDTPVNEIRRVYTDKIDEAKKQKPKTILPNSREYRDFMPQLLGLNSGIGLVNTSDYPQGLIQKQYQPFSAVCFIRVFKGPKNSGGLIVKDGTGFIISPGYIVTAGHGFDLEVGEEIKSVEIYTAIQNPQGEFAFRCYDGFSYESSSSSEGDDYALISVVSADLSLHGCFKLNNGSNVVGKSISNIGFPASEINKKYDIYESYDIAYVTADPTISWGTVASARSDVLIASSGVHTEEGMSGCPWIVVNGGYLEVVAINYGKIDGRAAGCRINEDLYNYFDSRVKFNSINNSNYIKNITLDKLSYFTGGAIKVSVWENPSQTSWVGLYKDSVTDYPNYSLGMWGYVENDDQNIPNTFTKKRHAEINLTAQILNNMNGNKFPLESGNYKIVLFQDNNYVEVAAARFFVGGSWISTVNYSNKIITVKYIGTTSTTAWIGIYHEYDEYGHSNPAIAWSYLPINNTISPKSVTIPVNLEPGRYKAILYADNEYVVLYTFHFSVYS